MTRLIFSYLMNMFTYKDGSLFLTSATLSAGFSFYLNEMTKDAEIKNLLIPITVQVVLFSFFMIFTMIDFITGIHVSYEIHQIKVKRGYYKGKIQTSYIKSYKLWRTFWKISGVSFLTFMITFITIISEIMGAEYIFWITIWMLILLWLMTIGFEFHSIGENIEKHSILKNPTRLSGHKPHIFLFFDKILNILQRKTLENTEDLLDKFKVDHRKHNENKSEEKANVEIIQNINVNVNSKYEQIIIEDSDNRI